MECPPFAYCDPALSLCLSKKGDGSVCNDGNECFSTFCTADDEVCCSTACSAACKSCNVDPMAGTCSNLAKGVIDKCANGLACNDSGSCTGLSGKMAIGQLCSASTECFNYVAGGKEECVNYLCRLHVGEVCDTDKPHECETNLCDALTHVPVPRTPS